MSKYSARECLSGLWVFNKEGFRTIYFISSPIYFIGIHVLFLALSTWFLWESYSRPEESKPNSAVTRVLFLCFIYIFYMTYKTIMYLPFLAFALGGH